MTAVSRSDGWSVRATVPLLVALTVYPANRLTAQVSFHLAAGVRYSSTLVHDSIVTPFDLRPALAPALLVSVRDELRPGWSADATLDVAPSRLRRYESTGGSFDAGSFTAFAFTVGLRRHFAPGASARLGIGGLRYAASQTGVFREGSGGIFPLGTVAATYALTPFARKRQLEVEARYDVHQFTTPALRTEGFRESRPVHRVALLVRIGWGGGGAAVTLRLAAALAGGLALAACKDPAIPDRAGVYSFADTAIIGVDTTVYLFHWPVARLPVRFWADPRGNMRFLVERAVGVWQDQFLYGELRGVIVNDSGSADVLMRWTDSVPPDVPPDTTPAPNACGGVTTFDYDSTGLGLAGPVHVSMTVLTGGPPASPAQVQACMRRVAIHELGHAVGLLRHSVFDEDIMYGSPIVDYPSPFDRRSAEVLYHTPPTIRPPPP